MSRSTCDATSSRAKRSHVDADARKLRGMKHLMLIAALVFAGCGKKSSDGPSCADAVNKAVAAMPGGPGGDDIKGKLVGIYTKHCTDDKWAADARKCYANDVHDMQSMKTCRSKLTQDQQDKVMADVRQTMMGAGMGGMGGMGGMHGGMGGPPPGAGGPPEGGAMGGAGAPPPAGSAGPAAPAGSAAP